MRQTKILRPFVPSHVQVMQTLPWQFFGSVIILLFLLTTLADAQEAPDKRMFKHGNAFGKGNKIIFVRGAFAQNAGRELVDYFNQISRQANFIVKDEDSVTDADKKEHLFLFGPVMSFRNLASFCPKALEIIPGGFRFNGHAFTDSLDAISLFSSDSSREFQIGTSVRAVKQLWTIFSSISQFVIMQNYVITYHGYLDNDEISPTDFFDVVAMRNKQLHKIETRYYTFWYDDAVFHGHLQDSIFFAEDPKIDRVLQTLNLHRPARKISCFLYKDIAQKYYLSGTPGYGNPFIKGWENHSLGFGAVEHESIHILFENELASSGTPTFLSEGIVGYYYMTTDSLELKRNLQIIAGNQHAPFRDYIDNTQQFEFSEMSYAMAALFARFIIDTYDLEHFKSFCMRQGTAEASVKIFGKRYTELADAWEAYYRKIALPAGPERKISFRVLANDLQDTDSVYIAGGNSQLGNWNPAGLLLKKQADGSRLGQLTLRQGTIITYKVTRGDWATERLDDKGGVPANTTYEVKGDDEIVIRVKGWKDRPGI